MKQREGITPRIRDRWIAAWEYAIRQGKYIPFLRTQDVPSSGIRYRVRGITTHRLHHVFSRLERLQLAILDHDRDIVDICEQYPLLPVGRTMAIARELGVWHPRYPRSETSIVVTSDFVTWDLDGNRCAYAVKPAKALKNARTVKKLAIEEAYWELEGVPWRLVTDVELRTIRNENLMDLQRSGMLSPQLLTLQEDWLWRFALEAGRHPEDRIREALSKVAQNLCIGYEASAELFHHNLWRGLIEADLDQRLSLAKRLDESRITVRV